MSQGTKRVDRHGLQRRLRIAALCFFGAGCVFFAVDIVSARRALWASVAGGISCLAGSVALGRSRRVGSGSEPSLRTTAACLSPSRDRAPPTVEPESIETIRQRLRADMVDFMVGDGVSPARDCGYTQNDIDECMAIVDAYLKALRGIAVARILPLVRDTVQKLNVLNARCESLIETGQREDLCEIIQVAARNAGLDIEDDITEEWREW
jgi:hypothetical protein